MGMMPGMGKMKKQIGGRHRRQGVHPPDRHHQSMTPKERAKPDI
jgi:signal recognition particle GTPase